MPTPEIVKPPEMRIFETLGKELPSSGYIALSHLGSCCSGETLEIKVNTGSFGLDSELVSANEAKNYLEERTKRMFSQTTGEQPKDVVMEIGGFNKNPDSKITEAYQRELDKLKRHGYRIIIADVLLPSVGQFSYSAQQEKH